MVLTTGGWGDGDEFAERGEDAYVADPNEDEAVDETAWPAICQARGEVHESALPCYENGAAEAKNGQETKVSLQRLWVSFFSSAVARIASDER